MKPGNAMPLAAMPVGTIVHNVEMKLGAGRPDRPLGRHLCPVCRPRPGLRDPAAQFRRAAAGQPELHGHGRRGLQSRPQQHQHRQGRAQPLARPQAERPRRRHEPDRPSRMAAARAVPPAGAIRSPRGASRPRARRPARTSAPTNSSRAAVTRAKADRKRLASGSFSLERPVRRRLSVEEGREGARAGRNE